MDELRAQCAQAQSLVEHSADIIALVDAGGFLITANPAAERLLGWDVEEFRGRCLLDLVHPNDLSRVLYSLAETAASPGAHPEVVYRLADAKGSWRTMASTSTNLLDDANVRAIVINARDASEAVGTLSSVVEALVRMSEVRDPYTAGHQRTVASLSQRICQLMTLSYAETERIRLGAELHDIGKIAIPGEVLAKPGKLTEAEWMMIRTHPTVGYEILAPTSIAGPVADIVLHHHERLDGSGYPHGIAGDEIAIGARIVAVADTIDAICSNRPYRPALGPTVAREVLCEGRGRLYAPEVVDAAVAVIARPESAP